MRKAITGCLVGVGGFLAAGFVGAVAHAQGAGVEYTPGFDPEQFTSSADPGSIALMDGARPLTMRSYSAGLIFNIGGPPLDICVSDGTDGCAVEGNLVNTRIRADLVAIFGFGRFDLRVILPTVLYQSSDFGPAMGEEALGSAGIGDLRLGGRVLIAEVGDLGVAGDLSFSLPTGGGENFIGDRGLLVDPKLIADYRPGRLGVQASFGYRYRQKPAQLANLYVNDELLWSVGAEYQLQPDKWTAGVAMYGRLGLIANPDVMDPGAAVGGEERPAEVLASSRYFVTDKLALEAGVGTALSSGYGAPPFRVLAGVRWVDRKLAPTRLAVDTDGDGIVDGDDQCRLVPEDVDGFEDSDGCPDDDNDRDGIPDRDDACPMDAEDLDGFQDADGCPDHDNDGDGIPDARDQCPDEAEDLDGFQDADGCPDHDNDGDGIPDATDQCPNDAEDLDGFQDADGCPDLDNDNDGIPDSVDQCPNEPEVYNGFQDTDGCPDDGKSIATVTSSGIEIADMIFFDTNKARIKTRSYKILDAVANVLRAHGSLRVRIEGHTDDQGSAAFNLTLSQSRAEAVRDYLVEKGVDAARLEPVGFGLERPLVVGKKEAARAKNRRVEFVIIGGASAGAAIAP